MRSTRTRRSLLAVIAASAIVFAACGGGDDGDSLPGAGAVVDDDGATDAVPASEDAAEGDEANGGTPVSGLLDTQVDLLGESVRAEAEIESNLLPPVILDDITTGRKVNFRNLVPQDKPILLWMYAPH